MYYIILFPFIFFISVSQRSQSPKQRCKCDSSSLAIISRVLVEANKAVCRNYLHDLLGATSLITVIMSANLILPVSEQEAVLLRQIKVMKKEENWRKNVSQRRAEVPLYLSGLNNEAVFRVSNNIHP